MLKIFKSNILLFLFTTIAATSCSDDDSDPVQPSTNNNNNNDLNPLVLGCNDIGTDSTLVNRSDGIDYIVPCFIDIDADLTIEPGVTIAFEQGAGMEIYGSIEAVGTASDSIVFTGVNKTPGAWENLVINSDDLNNQLQFCKVEYAGSSNGLHDAIKMDNQTKLILKNSSITNNKGKGLFVSRSGNIEDYAENKFSNNDDYPMQIAASMVRHLDGVNSIYSGNSDDRIYVNSNSIYDRGYVRGQDIHEWLDPGVPFFVNELVYVGETEFGHLRIKEGCELIFGSEFGIYVDEHNAILEVMGTQGNEVFFEGQFDAGSWNGIYINTNSTQNIIKHATISEGGQTKWRSSYGNTANLSLGSQGQDVTLTLQDVIISNSAGCGIVEDGTVNLTESNVTFNQNAGSNRCM